MLDTNARKYVQPAFEGIAKQCVRLKLSANHVTVIAFLLGMMTSLWIYQQQPYLALIFLWISGVLDAVDGTVARLTKTSSKWGTLMDLIFDRCVEIGMIISLAFVHKENAIYFVLLLSAILFSMCVFLAVGAMTPKSGNKTFRYQAGVMERCEGFICFSLMILLPKHIDIVVIVTTVLIGITAIQRLVEARKLFEEN